MDIFTTQLTRVVPVKIKPEKLKVKGLAKDAKTRKLDQEIDQNDGHEQDALAQQYAQDFYQQSAEKKAQTDAVDKNNSTPKDDSDEPPHHLDIFV
ncbi:hypothetical protein [Thalassotalea atypica]|uniref:hypothetical protein n=1 Tax=Thalassotalea atypica TaxID=2054316 RepID=UPI002573BF6D|nr:hypothetical protein [Thalassotalea atypica]